MGFAIAYHCVDFANHQNAWGCTNYTRQFVGIVPQAIAATAHTDVLRHIRALASWTSGIICF